MPSAAQKTADISRRAASAPWPQVGARTPSPQRPGRPEPAKRPRREDLFARESAPARVSGERLRMVEVQGSPASPTPSPPR